MTFKPKYAEKKKKDDNRLFLQHYFIIFDEIIKPYCSGSQTEVPNSLCLPDYLLFSRDFNFANLE